MKHEFLNGDAMKEIIQDNSIDLFIMWPPYMGVDVQRYGHTGGQINNTSDRVKFAKRLAKIAKNCHKAMKSGGNLLYVLPTTDILLKAEVYKQVMKKTDLSYGGTLIWNYRNKEHEDQGKDGKKILSAHESQVEHCEILWFFKDQLRVNEEYLNKNSTTFITHPLDPFVLQDEYGHLGNVLDSLPVEVSEILINMFSLPGDTVANVLSGTGSVSIAAENLGRDSVYNDISFVQLTIAKKRMEDLIDKKKRSK